MEVSVCITVFNEEKSILRLLDSLLKQTKKAEEVVVVDGGSKDKTVEIIRHYQKKNKRIKLLVQRCTRSRGRNLAVEFARSEIIAMTDADCEADKNWLKRIVEPFKHKEVDIVAGFYRMIAESAFQKAEAVFLGVTPSKFDMNFLPSTRSVAFRKRIWEEIGGFPERADNSAEDTDFNYKAIKAEAKFARVKNAIVEWRIPVTYKEFVKKIFSYAKWDAEYGIWWHPVKKFSSHNIKVFFKFSRYFVGVIILFFFVNNPLLIILLLIFFLLYTIFSFRKVYLETRSLKSGLWGIVFQFTTDFVVMLGFMFGKYSKFRF